MKASVKPTCIVLSILALLNVLFVPVFDIWGGLIPESVDVSFFDVIEAVFEDGDAWDAWVVQLTMSIFIPTVFMLIMALIGSKGWFIASVSVGIALWFKQIIDFCDQYDADALFDFENGSISIGTWIAIALFVSALFTAMGSWKKQQYYPTPVTPQPQYFAQDQNSQPQYYEQSPNPQPQYFEQNQNPQQYSVPDTIPFGTYTEQVASPRAFCPACGAKVTEESAFCDQCGTRL